MNNAQLLAEIQEANVSFLTLAQNLLKADRAAGERMLGVSGQVASTLQSLTPAQLSSIARSNTLLSRIDMDSDDLVFGLLTSSHRRPLGDGVGRAAAEAAAAPVKVAA